MIPNLLHGLVHGSLGVLETRLVNFAGMFLNRVQRELNAHRAVSRSGQAE